MKNFLFALFVFFFLAIIACNKVNQTNDVPKATPTPTLAPTPIATPVEVGQYSTRTIGKFLWKPLGEHTGKVVVLVDLEDVQVRIKSAKVLEMMDKPYSGKPIGWGAISRGNQPGCYYGSNVQVEFFDMTQGNKPIKTKAGAESKVIPNGCNRVQN
jgi:hypothetical protein